jgi:hypothetical protein
MDKKRTQFLGLYNMAQRLRDQGGYPQQDRMIHDKRWSLDHAVKYSYQGAKIRHIEGGGIAPALMNPNKLTQNYDDKVVSVGYEFNYKPGDVFEWQNTDSKWIIYLQDLTELAYFRGDCRRCRYQVTWENEDGEYETMYLAVRGPVETRIQYIQKSGISVDDPNYSVNFLMTKTPSSSKYFRRYSKFYLQGIEEGDPNTCWRVEAVDGISMPGILQINAVEYYANETEDDMENGIVGGLIVKPIDPATPADLIVGETFIKPKTAVTYTYEGTDTPRWWVDKKYPVELKANGNKASVTWLKAYNGEFEIECNGHKKTIVVESLY